MSNPGPDGGLVAQAASVLSAAPPQLSEQDAVKAAAALFGVEAAGESVGPAAGDPPASGDPSASGCW